MLETRSARAGGQPHNHNDGGLSWRYRTVVCFGLLQLAQSSERKSRTTVGMLTVCLVGSRTADIL